jgi:SAM-dependent methyltransferase
MADADSARWNERFSGARADFTPSAWLTQMRTALAPSKPGSVALDIACGPGRHALWLAELGYRVEAWDISDVALSLLRTELETRAQAGQLLPVSPRQLDFDRAILSVNAFDLILDAHFLDRALFPQMTRALRPSGLLVIHTFLHVDGGPTTSRLSNPLHALKPGELRSTFAEALELLDLREDDQAEETHLLARRP